MKSAQGIAGVDQTKQAGFSQPPSCFVNLKIEESPFMHGMSRMVEYMLVMYGCYSALSESERQELQKWEKENLDGCTVGTADWPEWVKYIGSKSILPPIVKTVKKSIPLVLRISVYRRDGFKCVFCCSEKNLTIDHKIPESKGGLTVLENLQTACRPCNAKKGTKL